MTSKRLAGQSYTKEWKRARRETLKVLELDRAELDSRDAARAEQDAQEAVRLYEHYGPAHMPPHPYLRVGQKRWRRDWMDLPCVETEDDTLQLRTRNKPPRSFWDSSRDDDSTPMVRKRNRIVNTSERPMGVATPFRASGSSRHASPTNSPVGQPDSRQELGETPNPVQAIAHGGEKDASNVVHMERMMEECESSLINSVGALRRSMEEHMGQMSKRMNALEAVARSLTSRVNMLTTQMDSPQSDPQSQSPLQPQPQPQFPLLPQHQAPLQQDDVLLAPCSTVEELVEMDSSLAQPDKKNSMQHFLGRIGGKNVGDAIRRIVRRVATNSVLSQYSLRGRRDKKPFQDLRLYKIIIVACMKNFPDQTEASIERCIGDALKFSPHRQLVGQIKQE